MERGVVFENLAVTQDCGCIRFGDADRTDCLGSYVHKFVPDLQGCNKCTNNVYPGFKTGRREGHWQQEIKLHEILV